MKAQSKTAKSKKAITAAQFDEKFDAGEDMSDYVDWSKAIKRVNLDLPVWAVKSLDRESERRGITRQSLIKTWIIDRLDQLKADQDAG